MFFYRITSENHSNDVSIVKRIITEKYDDVVYFDDSNYLYAYNQKKQHEYTVFDYNGNKLYEINSENRLNIISVYKKYYITYENEYHLYNSESEEIISGNNIYGISDHLIFVDNNIINIKGEELFKNITNIKAFYNNKYFLVDNYFINQKGKVLLYDYKIITEKVNKNEIDYFIVKKDNKYYCFFPLINNIIGDGFKKYFEYGDKIYIVSNNKVYEISMNGLRKEITFTINKNINKDNINYSNAVRKNRILTFRDYYLGVLETDTNKFHRIAKTRNFSFEFINQDYINIKFNNKNHVYDLNNYKIVYENNFDDIVIFNNNYKTIKVDDKYYLLDDKDRRITYSDRQIILLNSKVKIGNIEHDIALFDKELYPGESIIVNKKLYYKYKHKNIKSIISSDLKEKYDSNLYINYMDDTIVKTDKNRLYFYNKKNNKEYVYSLSDYRIKNKEINKNEIVLSNNKNIIVLNKKAKVVKKISNVKLNSINYIKSKQAIILIVEKSKLNKTTKGAYVLK
jgi:hypothetical protein